jgi:phospholipid/cholesterol/gamma-HCH transport system substrate-binding protein
VRRRARRGEGGMTPFAVGALALVLVVAGAVYAFTKVNPFANPYELTAVFDDVQNLKPRSPVRIAGVEVGEVKEIEALEDGSGHARVRMRLREQALPIHADAQAQILPRLFLEGNFVIAISPGTPDAGEIADGGTIPVGQTSHSVSFEQILKVLDKDTRQSLQTLLDEYSRALVTGGARGFNRSIRHWERAYRNTALASQGLLGTRPGDLSRVLRGQQRTFAALARDPETLQDLVTDLNATVSAFANEDEALRASIPALRDTLRAADPALVSLNAAFPALRAFAREALPGVRSAPAALAASEPFVRELGGLFGAGELRGLSRELRATVPSLARLNAGFVRLLGEQRLLSSCTANVLVPFAETPIPDPDFPEASGEPFFQEIQRSFVGLAGESRTGDANGQWFRINAGSGPTTLVIPGGETIGTVFAQTNFPQLGARPGPAPRPRFRPDVPCETQEPPNLNAPRGEADTEVEPQPQRTAASERLERRIARELPALVDAFRLERQGKPADNPFSWSEPGRRR